MLDILIYIIYHTGTLITPRAKRAEIGKKADILSKKRLFLRLSQQARKKRQPLALAQLLTGHRHWQVQRLLDSGIDVSWMREA
jgi:hypothetical protein